MQSKTKYPLLREAIAIAMGIPDDRLNLSAVLRKNQPGVGKGEHANTCGTIGCVIGWLSLHPKFNKLGLTSDTDGVLYLYGRPSNYEDAASKLFGLQGNQAFHLFSGRGSSKWDGSVQYDSRGYDKRLHANRVRKFLMTHGEHCAI